MTQQAPFKKEALYYSNLKKKTLQKKKEKFTLQKSSCIVAIGRKKCGLRFKKNF